MGSTTTVRSAPANGIPPDAPPPEAIREQLGRILASPLFRSSKHYPNLLKHVVEQTLAGHAAGLKERSLGMEVFGRDPHYDTNADPVVRTSACEVRKRLAQYYHEPSREAEIRIELPAGSYVPEFHFPEMRAVELPSEPPVMPAPVKIEPRTEPPAGRRWQRYPFALAVAVLAAGVLVVWALAGSNRSKGALEQFWEPVWNRADSVIICLGVFPNHWTDVPTDPTQLQTMWNDRVAFADALTMGQLTALLQGHGKQYDVRRGSTFTLEDLRKKPAVLIGAFDNPWTMALGKELRFTLELDQADRKPFIRDRQNPTQVRWRGDFDRPYAQVKEDYAIVSRYMDARTERMAVLVAGMGKDGTAAAGEFVTGQRYLETLASGAPANWERRNLQVVLATDVINGNSGPPRVLTTYFW